MRIFLRRPKASGARHLVKVVKRALCSGGVLLIRRDGGGIAPSICLCVTALVRPLARCSTIRRALIFVGRGFAEAAVTSENLSYGCALVTSTRPRLAAF